MLNDKAHENLQAGEILLARGHVNAAASRLYYAMYQAAVHRLTRLGIRPGNVRSGAVEWDHSMVENNAKQLRGRWSDRLLYRQCRARRVEADYTDIPVREIDVRECRGEIADLVGDLTR